MRTAKDAASTLVLSSSSSSWCPAAWAAVVAWNVCVCVCWQKVQKTTALYSRSSTPVASRQQAARRLRKHVLHHLFCFFYSEPVRLAWDGESGSLISENLRFALDFRLVFECVSFLRSCNFVASQILVLLLFASWRQINWAAQIELPSLL